MREMKPIKLTMTAFGPYKGCEVVNFSELEDNRLFVISGKTGAGKTTIFDGICFALYGSASGEDRQDYKMLRSDFANDDVHTSVELIFELHGKMYRILRQLGHVKQGNKTATGEKYEFYQINDTGEAPCVDRQMVSDINQRIEEIIGLTKDQFSQIVMLPQGEFRKLLTSKTENKEEILRRIFQTYPYQTITEQLNTKRKQAEEDFKRVKQLRDHYVAEIRSKLPDREGSTLFTVLNQEHFNINQLVAGLEAEANYYNKQVETMQEEKGKVSENVQAMQDQYQKAKNTNEKFDELAQHEKKLTELHEQEPIIKDQESLLEKSERASQIELQENHVKELRQELDQKRRAKADAEHALTTANAAHEQAKTQYKTEEARKSERDNLSKQVNNLKDLLPKVEELNTKKKTKDKAEVLLKQLAVKKETFDTNFKEKEKAKEELDKQIRADTEAVERLQPKKDQLNLLREKATALKELIKLVEKRDQLSVNVKAEEQVYQQAKIEFEQKEQAWIHGQAGILAEHLQDGEPCPVCGSVEHPNKAKIAVDTPSKAELDQVKSVYDKKYKAYTDLVAQYKTHFNQVKEKESVLKEYDISLENPNQTFDLYLKQGKELNEEVKALDEKWNQLKGMRERADQLADDLKHVETQRESLRKQNDEQKIVYERAKVSYESLLESVPEDLRELSALAEKITKTEAKKRELDETWEKAQQQLNIVRESVAKAETHHQNASLSLQNAITKLEKAERTFKQSLAEGDFSNEEEYRNAKRTEEE